MGGEEVLLGDVFSKCVSECRSLGQRRRRKDESWRTLSACCVLP